MQKKAFVLLSGGIDSTTCLYQAVYDLYPGTPLAGFIRDLTAEKTPIDWVEAVSIDYGQRHSVELTYAAATCERLNIKHTVLDIGSLLSGKEILLSAESGAAMVQESYDTLKGVSPSYVPFRNGLMLSALTAYAQRWVNAQIAEEEESLRANAVSEGMLPGAFDQQDFRMAATANAKDIAAIYYGAHAEDAANWAYPDCTPEFNGSMANAIYTGSYNTIRLATPLQWMRKHEIIAKGAKLGVDFSLTWSCYDRGTEHCGKCPTCRARKEAFEIAGVTDLTKYAGDADV